MSIDDNAVDQLMYQRAILRADLATCHLQFTDPLKALSQLTDPSTPQTELILLDVNMPQMNGFEFLIAAGQALPSAAMPPVVLMCGSALSAVNQRQAANCKAIIAQLDKPLKAATLLMALKQARIYPPQ